MDNSDFVTKFYNLEGDLIPERKKNFFRLLKSHPSPLNEYDLNNLIPRTYLERLFQIDIFIYYKIYSKLLDVIKEGNEVFISKILKRPLVLKEVIGNISAESFVNDFLPFTSYAIRMKILKRISFFLDESQMDEIVYWVHKRYGLHIAVKILHTCSSKKIEEFLSNHEITLKPRQVKFIFDKDPDLLLMYLDHYQNLTGKPYYHRHLCRYIALKNPELWFKLKKKRAIYILSLGRKASKNIICYNYSDFLKNVEHYSEFLKLNVIARKLHGKFTDIYFELFPRNMSDLRLDNFCQTLLKYYPKNKQWDLFAQTFLNIFGSTVLDNLLYLDYSFLKLFPNKSVKQKWGEVHYNKDKSQFHRMAYCDPNKVIPLIKEKINVTSDTYDRFRSIETLLDNCVINEDMLALETVLKYICIRCRNDDFLSKILREIKDRFKLEELNESHWNYINEIIKILSLRKQLNFYPSNEFAIKYIEYLFLHGKPFREELAMYIKNVDINSSWFHMDIKDPNIEKQILTEIINIYPDVIELYATQKEKFVCDIINFNEKNSECKLELSNFPYLFTYIDFIIKKDWELESNERKTLAKVLNYNLKFPERPLILIEEQQILKIFQNNLKDFCFTDAIEMIIAKPNRSQFENDVLHFFWQNLLKSPLHKKTVCWFFDNEPKTLIPYFNSVITIDKKCISCSKIKLMSHLDFDKMMISFCTGKLELIDDLLKDIRQKYAAGGDCSAQLAKEIKEKIDSNIDSDTIEILSLLLSTREYMEIVAQRFLPIKKKLNVEDEALNEIYFLQCAVAKFFKKVQEPVLALPTLMNFCLGDYLKSALPALYSICYRAPENIVYSYIELLSKRAVSVKKHALFLSCQLLDFNYVLNTLQEASTSNVKSQKHVFSSTLKYFCKNPCDELLNFVIVSLNTIDKNDEETLKSLTRVRIPKKYKHLYIEKCWYFFETLREKEVAVVDYLQLFFNAIVKSRVIFASLPVNFYRHILTQYFKEAHEKDYRLDKIYRFVCMILQQKKSEQFENFEFVFNMISNFKNNKKTDDIKSFFSVFYDFALKDIKSNSKIDVDNNYYIELFKINWVKLLTPIEMFDEHVLLDLLYLKSKSSCDLKIYAQEIVGYLEELVVEYGPYIFYKFKNILLSKEKYTQKEKYSFFLNILEFKNSTLNCILILELLETKYYGNNETKEMFDKVKQILNNSTDPVVSIYYNSCLT